jgi:hypothetical protein
MKNIAVAIGTEFFSGGGNSSGVFGGNDLTGIAKLISMFLRGAFALAGLILLFYFIMSGIALMSSAGKDDPKTAAGAKATLTSAVIGFIVVFTAYWIVKLIGTLIGQPNII